MSQRPLEIYSTSNPSTFMVSYIRRYFADILGDHAGLLDEPGGLDRLAELVREGRVGPRSRS